MLEHCRPFIDGLAVFRALLRVLLVCLGSGSLTIAAAQSTPPSIALYYGAEPPLAELQAFDIVVLEPDHAPSYIPPPAAQTQWFAYVSVIETHPDRSYAKDIPAGWQRGDNRTWGSRLIDQTATGWPAFFEQRVIAPLWQRGFRGFFLDTLDSYHLFAATPAQKRAQEDALLALLERLPQRFPGIQLILNRGFEVLPRISAGLRSSVTAVAAESLFRGWDHAAQQYREVPAADREWLLAQLNRVRKEQGLQVLAIDYVAPGQRALARETARRIRALGFVPWISNPALDTVGLGNIELQPRRVALVTDMPEGADFQHSTAMRFLAMPLHYLGYTIDPIDVRRTLPGSLDAGRYAAVITWFSQPVMPLNARFPEWLQQQLDGGLRLVMMNAPGLDLDAALWDRLGLIQVQRPSGLLSVQAQDALIGFEMAPPLQAGDVTPLRLQAQPAAVAAAVAAAATPLLRLRSRTGVTVDGAALTSWGGFAFTPYATQELPTGNGTRWVINPIEFLRRALAPPDAPPFPVPDVTTESGRRLLLVHVDGDGFVSRAERSNAPFAGEVLLREVFEQYRIPTTMSVIQGEIAGNGMFRQLAPTLEDIARRIFALPYVEMASHSYSHPFYWRRLQKEAEQARDEQVTTERALNLMLPGYRFDLRTEIQGSLDYINQRLAPAGRQGKPGKQAQVFLWTGDTVPTTEAVAQTVAAGVLNMNGGDTLITRSNPTLTAVSGLALRRGPHLHVFAPNQNENVYTNNWTGPFYGYQRVIETFELTEQPLRLKPINIYYHSYAATKTASLQALHRVYGYALQQPVVPVYASDYIRKVLDFHDMTIARDWAAEEEHKTPTWRVRGAGELRTLRIPAAQPLSLRRSQAVSGAADGPGKQRYLHLSAASATVAYGDDAAPLPHLVDASGWSSGLTRSPEGFALNLHFYATPLRSGFSLAHAARCTVRADGQPLMPLPAASAAAPTLTRYEIPSSPKRAATEGTQASVLVDVRCPR